MKERKHESSLEVMDYRKGMGKKRKLSATQEGHKG